MMRFIKWKIVIGFNACVALAPAVIAQAKLSPPAIARVGEQAIYDEDLLPSIGAQLLQLKNQEYELRIKALDGVVNQRLLEDRANRKGLSVEALLEQEVDRNVPRPTADEIEVYYLAQKDRLNQPIDEVRPQLEQSLTQARRQQARQNYISRLRQETSVSILLTRPRVEVAVDLSRLRGSLDAPVTIVEFADFQCPYCQEVQQTVSRVLDKYKGKVRLGFRDFPLRQIHPQAELAAEASRCAGEQGNFWDYHDRLYANQARLDPDVLKEHSHAIGLDVQRFGDCLASGKFVPAIEGDLQEGAKYGVSATPTFYINGVVLVGNQPVSAFEKIIESELAGIESKKP
jgi:protein-disulfide isomerase